MPKVMKRPRTQARLIARRPAAFTDRRSRTLRTRFWIDAIPDSHEVYGRLPPHSLGDFWAILLGGVYLLWRYPQGQAQFVCVGELSYCDITSDAKVRQVCPCLKRRRHEWTFRKPRESGKGLLSCTSQLNYSGSCHQGCLRRNTGSINGLAVYGSLAHRTMPMSSKASNELLPPQCSTIRPLRNL